MKTLRNIVLLILGITFALSCEKNEPNQVDDKLPTKEYDKQYFNALINGDSISIHDSLSQLTNSKIYTQIGFESPRDSIVLNYGFRVKDEINNSFTLTIWFIVKELVDKLDTADLYHWEYSNITELNNLLSNNDWNYIIDSNYSSVGALLDEKGKSYTGIYITYRSEIGQHRMVFCNKYSKLSIEF